MAFSLFKKGISTIQNDGFAVFLIRIYNFALVKLQRIVIPADKNNIKKWHDIKGKFNEKRIFIIGNGPSLNKTPLYLLKDEYVMCFNRFNLLFERLNWKPSFYMVTDDLVIKDMYTEINTEILPNVQYAFFPDIHPSNVNFKKRINNHKNVYWLNADYPEFRTDLPKCGINKTVVNAGIQVAAYMGFSEIYLVGVDMTFEDQKVKKINSRNWEADDQDPNHFDPRYFAKGRKYHNPTVHEMIEKFEIGKAFFNNLGIQIFNAGIGGKLEVFQRISFPSLFNYTDELIKNMLSDISYLKEQNLSFEFILATANVPEDYTNCSELSVFKLNENIAQPVISKLIATHVAIGPYKNEYFFIKRTKGSE